MTLREAYNTMTKAYCAGCGCLLHTNSREDVLSNYFIMDRECNFYCIDCEQDFADGDERIYSPDLEEEHDADHTKVLMMHAGKED